MTTKQIQWAAQHDWYLTKHEAGGVLVRDYTPEGSQTFVHFTNFKELKTWAGY